jgi:hypothetical protein
MPTLDKKVTLITFGSLITVAALAYGLNQDPVIPERYCVELKDGKMIMVEDNKPLTSEVTLNDGSKLTPAAMVIKKDGTVLALKTGDCIDKEGNVNNAAAPQTPIRKTKETNKQ